VYPSVLAELRAGAKRSHWMWFVFPQIARLGFSEMARHYAIAGRSEAEAYLVHPMLGARLVQCTDAMLEWSGRRSAEAILGTLDVLKFKSSMTLFETASGSDAFGRVLEAFYAGHRDERTLESCWGSADKPRFAAGGVKRPWHSL
jgi:uncharacterized protein (DUF1810 family)